MLFLQQLSLIPMRRTMTGMRFGNSCLRITSPFAFNSSSTPATCTATSVVHTGVRLARRIAMPLYSGFSTLHTTFPAGDTSKTRGVESSTSSVLPFSSRWMLTRLTLSVLYCQTTAWSVSISVTKPFGSSM